MPSYDTDDKKLVKTWSEYFNIYTTRDLLKMKHDYACFLSSKSRSCNSFCLKILEIGESNDEGYRQVSSPRPYLSSGKSSNVQRGLAGWDSACVCACVCNQKDAKAIMMHQRVVLDLAQWALGCNFLFSFPLASPLSPSSTMFLLSLLSLESTLQGCFLQFNLILIPAAHPLFKSNINILCSFHFLNIMNFPK